MHDSPWMKPMRSVLWINQQLNNRSSELMIESLMNGIQQGLCRSCEFYEDSKLDQGVNVPVLSGHDLERATERVCRGVWIGSS